jgi:flagellar hook-associated protein 3 FlgL
VFTTLSNIVTALQAPTAAAGARAQQENALNVGLQNLDQALNKVLTVRATLGARMNEVSALTSTNSDQSLQYQKNLSSLQDLDYNSALSTFASQQLALQAAQKSFAQVANLSLFQFLP